MVLAALPEVVDGETLVIRRHTGGHAACKVLPAPILARYEFIRSRLANPVIVSVDQGVCSGCNISIPPQFFIELQKGQQILSCPNCQRLIFWVGHVPEEDKPQEAPKAEAV